MTISEFALKDIRDSLTLYPKLSLQQTKDNYFIQGTWEVSSNEALIDTFEIKIDIPDKYPEILPSVFELSGKIPKKPDRHIERQGNACLFVQDARWEIWPIGDSFLNFLRIPVHNFFLWQVYFDEYGTPPPWGERGHGEKGIVEYYLEKFQLSDIRKVFKLLVAINQPHKKSCPCGSQKQSSQCHENILQTLKQQADPSRIQNATNIFYKFIIQEDFINGMKYHCIKEAIFSKQYF